MTTKADFTKETSLTTGILFYELQGAAIGFRTFISAVGSGETVRYSVTDGIEWEVSEGVISSGATDTLSRDTILSSSNSGNAVNWGEGEKTVSLVLTSNDINEFLTSNNNLLDVADAATARTNLGIDISSFVTKSNNLSDLDSASTALTNLGIANHDDITVDGSGNVTVPAVLNVTSSSGFGNIEVGGPSGGYIDLKAPASDDYDGRIITTGTGLNIVSGSGGVTLSHQNNAKLATTSSGVSVTGNVGIGTSSPQRPLHIAGTTNAFIRIEDSDNNADTDGLIGGLEIRGADGQNAGVFQFSSNGNRDIDIGNETSTGALDFRTNSTQRMRIDSSGNVGIGTSSPSALLHLSGTLPRIYLTDTDTSTQSEIIGDNGWLTLNAASSRIVFNIGGSEIIRATSSGISVTGSVTLGNWSVTQSGTDLVFATGGTNKMKLDASGNLTVVGDVTAFGTV